MRDLAKRAEALEQVYPAAAEREAIVGVTVLVTSLAMNFVHRGAYFPEAPPAASPVEKDTRPPKPPIIEGAKPPIAGGAKPPLTEGVKSPPTEGAKPEA
jgi:hypothetical protein